jgi:hypothetical protein
MEFNSILIGSEDPQRLVDYYTKLLGQPAMSDGGYTGWALGAGWVTIGPHDQVKGKNAIATFADPDDNYFQLMSPMGPM